MCLLGVMAFDLIFYLQFSGNYCQYLGKRFLDFFHIAHAHLLGCEDVPFSGYDLRSDF